MSAPTLPLAALALSLALTGCPRSPAQPDAGSSSSGVASSAPTAAPPLVSARPPAPVPREATPVDFGALNAVRAGKKPDPDCTPGPGGVRYDVGSARTPTLGEVPWTTLHPGDVVCVPYRPEPYRDKIYFLARGAPGAPIRLVGLRGPRGERPTIDGDEAVTSKLVQPTSKDSYLEAFGVVNIITHFAPPKDAPWGWHPGWITISGLKIQHARPAAQFTDSSGAKKHYADFSASIYINPGDNVIVEDCEITESQIGVFAKSFEKTPGQVERVTENLTLRGNFIHDNGDEKLLGVHNVYIEARGCNIIGNYLGHKAGLKGSNYKSRCSHERIFANWIVGGYQSLLKLVDPQSGWDTIGVAPDYEPTVVAGNVLVNPNEGSAVEAMVHFGGDGYTQPERYRRELVFYANTVVAPMHGHAYVHLVGLPHFTREQPTIQAWLSSNVVFNTTDGLGPGVADFSLASGAGTALLSHNWIGPTVPLYDQYEKNRGRIVGWDGASSGADPGILAAPAATKAIISMRPARTSPLVDQGEPFTALPAESGAGTVKDFALYEVTGTREDPWYQARQVHGAVDIGAYEAGR